MLHDDSPAGTEMNLPDGSGYSAPHPESTRPGCPVTHWNYTAIPNSLPLPAESRALLLVVKKKNEKRKWRSIWRRVKQNKSVDIFFSTEAKLRRFHVSYHNDLFMDLLEITAAQSIIASGRNPARGRERNINLCLFT